MKKLQLFLTAVMLICGFTAMSQEKTVKDLYPNLVGNLRFNISQLNFQNVNNTDTKTDTLKLYNEWSKPMNLSFATLPDYIICKAVPEILKPQQKGYVLIAYNAAKRNDFGFIYDRFSINTNDSLQAEKSISISVNIVEDFSKLTPAQLANAAKITIDSITFDFGTIKQGDKIEHDFTFKNTGKSDLIIRKTKGSCGCTVGTPDKSTLKPGESSAIHVTFNSAGKSGHQSKTVTITSNDPGNSSSVITLTGTVEVSTDTTTKQQTPAH
jgi:hypothetical protein